MLASVCLLESWKVWKLHVAMRWVSKDADLGRRRDNLGKNNEKESLVHTVRELQEFGSEPGACFVLVR